MTAHPEPVRAPVLRNVPDLHDDSVAERQATAVFFVGFFVIFALGLLGHHRGIERAVKWVRRFPDASDTGSPAILLAVDENMV